MVCSSDRDVVNHGDLCRCERPFGFAQDMLARLSAAPPVQPPLRADARAYINPSPLAARFQPEGAGTPVSLVPFPSPAAFEVESRTANTAAAMAATSVVSSFPSLF